MSENFNPPIIEPDYTDAGEYAWHLCELLGDRGDPHYTQVLGTLSGTHIRKSETAYIHGPHHGVDGHLYVNGPVTIEVQVDRETAEKIMKVLAESWQPAGPWRYCTMRIVHGSRSRRCCQPYNHDTPHVWGDEI